MQITKGVTSSALKCCIYGPEGIGKSTFASKFPNTVFIDTEGSTKFMDVSRTKKPSSWTELMTQVKYFRDNPSALGTLIIDTADWAEMLCIEHICAKAQKAGIEDFGYGKGYTYLEEEFGRFLNLLEEVVERGVNIVITAHAAMRKFEQPDEMGAYDRWELKLEKKTAPLLKEWADMVLFANYKTIVINVDNQGSQKGKNKAQGGQRVMYTSHHPCWDAKNRFGLKEELPFEYSEISKYITCSSVEPTPVELISPLSSPSTSSQTENIKESISKVVEDKPEYDYSAKQTPVAISDEIPQALADLMRANFVIEAEIQKAVSAKGYYPINTPIKNYDPQFVDGVLVAAWEQVFNQIIQIRKDEIPF